MSKKEINVFSVSFLDLLSGALAAVIILFVIIPKMTSEQQETIETINSLEVQVDQIDSLIQMAANCIDQAVMTSIQSELDEMRENLRLAEARVMNTEQQLENARQRNRSLENQLVETEDRIREMEEILAEANNRPTQGELEELQNDLREALVELEEMRESAAENATGAGAAMFGLNAKFAVVADWSENLDVDLYMKNVATNEWICYNLGSQHSWGKYLGDVTSRSEGDGRFEMIYQETEIVPGDYEVWYHLYTNTDTGSARVAGYAVIHPFTGEEQKIKFPDQVISHNSRPDSGGGLRIGVLRVRENSITLN